MKELRNYTIAGILFVLAAGTLSHFIYEWTGENTLAGLFVPVNESTWEHMKLIFFPMLLYSFFLKHKLESKFPCITSALPFGILCGTLLIPVLFYTYTGILGFHVFFLDLATFFFSVLLAFYAVFRLSSSCCIQKFSPALYGLLCLFFLCFLLFSYFPPNIGIFAEPVSLNRS